MVSIRRLSCCGLLLALGVCAGSAQQTPLTQEQLLAAARNYADQYIDRLPSFICTQTVEQFEANRKAKHWRKGDSLTAQLVWDQGRERRTLQMVNNRALSERTLWRSPLVSEGEFGNLLDSVLGSPSHAVFSWHGWENVGEKRVGVFEYHVDQQHSSLRLTLGSVQTVVAFQGLVYTDETSGTVWRITNNASEIPSELRTKSISRAVDYSEVAIGDMHYVLPVHATILLDTGTGNIRNELHFEQYRKFSADSHISFAAEDAGKH